VIGDTISATGIVDGHVISPTGMPPSVWFTADAAHNQFDANTTIELPLQCSGTSWCTPSMSSSWYIQFAKPGNYADF
jgi:hypothetical protein